MKTAAPQAKQATPSATRTDNHTPFFTPFIQPKLTINQPNDVYEQEADTVADKVMRMPDLSQREPFFKPAPAIVQRKCSHCAEEEKKLQLKQNFLPVQRKCKHCESEERLHRKETTEHTETPAVSPAVEQTLQSPGQPMDDSTRSFMEDRFQYDFSSVKIHNDTLAHQSSGDIHARAYTHGNHIAFNAGQYQPHTDEGKKLMAHELAHVVQQSGETNSFIRPKRKNEIQRFIYWSAKSPFGKSASGNQTEKVLEDDLLAKDKDLKKQAPIPNADREGHTGFDSTGRADLYKASKTLEVFWGKPVTGKCITGDDLGTPLSVRDKKREISKGGTAEFIAGAPTDITLGEIKPANEDQVKFGRNQLGYYEEGIKFARSQSNCWAKTQGLSQGWPSVSFHRIVPDIPAAYIYNAASPKQDLSLGVFDFVNEDKAPIERIKLNIRVPGGLYFKDMGKGLIVYFYRPASLAQVMQNLGTGSKSAELTQYASYATDLQNKVIAPLTTGPKQVAAKPLDSPAAAPKVSKAKPAVQRKQKKKETKLEDTFNLDAWNSDFTTYQNNFKTKNTGFRDKLQFMELAKEAEQNDKWLGIGGAALPGFDITVGKKDGAPVHKNIYDLYDWMHHWSGEPVKYLGRLRKKFGGAFVKVAGFFSNIKQKISDRIDGAGKTNSPGGNSWGQIAIRAFWRALVATGKLVLREVGHLLVESLVSGLKKRLSEYIPTDRQAFIEMVENEFPVLKSIEEKIQSLEDGFLGKIESIVAQFDDYIQEIKKIGDTFRQFGDIIKWANVALQCGTPPGFGCLKLLLTALIQYWIDKILSWCWTQKKFAGLVQATGVIDAIPKKIAGYAADGVEYFLPGAFLPVFDRTVFEKKPDYDPDEIPCGDEVTDAQKAMVELDNTLARKLGLDYINMLKAMELYGVSPDEPLTAGQIRDIINKLPANISGSDLTIYLENSKGKERQPGDKLDIADFLKHVEKVNEEYFERTSAPVPDAKSGDGKQPSQTGDGSGGGSSSSGSGATTTEGAGANDIYTSERENIHGQKVKGAGKIHLTYRIIEGIQPGQYKGDKVKISIVVLAHENTRPFQIITHNIAGRIYDRKFYKEYPKQETSAANAKKMAVFVELTESAFFIDEKEDVKITLYVNNKLKRPYLIDL